MSTHTDGRCPFGRLVARPHIAINHCPQWQNYCPCEMELVVHGFGEVDQQTCEVVRFWQRHAPMDCVWDRELLPKFQEAPE